MLRNHSERHSFCEPCPWTARLSGASHRMEGLPWTSATSSGTGPQRTGVNSIAGSRRMPLSARHWRPDLSLWPSPDFLPDQMTRARRAIANAVACESGQVTRGHASCGSYFNGLKGRRPPTEAASESCRPVFEQLLGYALDNVIAANLRSLVAHGH